MHFCSLLHCPPPPAPFPPQWVHLVGLFVFLDGHCGRTCHKPAMPTTCLPFTGRLPVVYYLGLPSAPQVAPGDCYLLPLPQPPPHSADPTTTTPRGTCCYNMRQACRHSCYFCKFTAPLPPAGVPCRYHHTGGPTPALPASPPAGGHRAAARTTPFCQTTHLVQHTFHPLPLLYLCFPFIPGTLHPPSHFPHYRTFPQVGFIYPRLCLPHTTHGAPHMPPFPPLPLCCCCFPTPPQVGLPHPACHILPYKHFPHHTHTHTQCTPHTGQVPGLRFQTKIRVVTSARISVLWWIIPGAVPALPANLFTVAYHQTGPVRF